jgi:hypothetical protein
MPARTSPLPEVPSPESPLSSRQDCPSGAAMWQRHDDPVLAGQRPRGGREVVAGIPAEQMPRLGDVRREHDPVRAAGDQALVLAERPERVRVQHRRRIRPGGAEDLADQPRRLVDVVEARTDRDDVGAPGQVEQLVRHPVALPGQPHHLRLRHGDAQGGHRLRVGGQLQPAGARAQCGHAGQQDRARGEPGTADHEHRSARLLVLPGLRQPPLAQQPRRDDLFLRWVGH